MKFFACQKCGVESSVRMSKSYIKAEADIDLRKLGWKVERTGWRFKTTCPDCSEAKSG